jgi:tight adherence protein C
VLAGLIGLALCPLMTWLGIQPFGPWPVWAWAASGAVGFLAPDWQLEQTLAVRRMRCLMELPTILDMLTIATSAGLALEQALLQVARQSTGTVAQELRHASREMALGQRSLVDALEAMAGRNTVPELSSFASQVRAAHEQGLPLVQTLSLQADALREQKRLRIVEEGGKATVRMILPVALFILPVLFVVLLAPAALELMHLGG